MVLAEKNTTEMSIADCFVQLKQEQYTGSLTVNAGTAPGYQLYFLLGRLLYATGGHHPVRRWWRYCNRIAPHLGSAAIEKSLQKEAPELGEGWEYSLLCHLRGQQLLSSEQAARIIQGVANEILLTLRLASKLTYEYCTELPGQKLQQQLVLLDPIMQMIKQLQVWPNLEQMPMIEGAMERAPQIVKPEKLQEITTPTTYQTLTSLLTGERTIWDLSLITGKLPQEVLASLQYHISHGLIRLAEVTDFAPPAAPSGPCCVLDKAKPLIACVDDSDWVCKTLSDMLSEAGYDFLPIQDGLRAIPTLLSKKPALILLDLRMPNTNGYEICMQLRKLSAFVNTPILILTGNDGVVDRVRAKMAGATDFLSKTISREKLLATLEQHLTEVEAAVG
jgi:chemotaxis family two-component system response regulator PixG